MVAKLPRARQLRAAAAGGEPPGKRRRVGADDEHGVRAI